MTSDLRPSACILLVLCATSCANGGNILVWYTEGSHWINMKLVLETLIDRGHQVTVLVPSSSMYMNTNEPARFHYEPFNASFSLEALQKALEEFLYFSLYESDYMSNWELYIRLTDMMKDNLRFSIQYLDGVVKSEAIMTKLQEGNYDLLLADPIYPGSELVADILGIPLVFSLRFSLVNNWERYCGQMPAPPSFKYFPKKHFIIYAYILFTLFLLFPFFNFYFFINQFNLGTVTINIFINKSDICIMILWNLKSDFTV
uniref:Uncharacterized protein n=1 Tax=Neolamprologus brichardi TaxID=32507 RepID=A0A3Q4H421_NEOBR